MKIEEYLRNEFSKYIRPIIIKNKCDKCGSNEKLELHHETQFAKTLNQTINELALEYKDSDDYAIKELKLLSNIMLGKQIKQEYLTLCPKCHKDIKVNVFRPRNDKDILLIIKNYECELPLFDYYKNNEPWKGLEYLREEYINKNISLDDLMYLSVQLEILNPNFKESYLSDKEKVRIKEILKSVGIK